jgi:hypothetical protein
MKLTIQKRVDNGVKLLNTNKPGWLKKVDIETLDIADDTKCVLGQVFASRKNSSGYLLAIDDLKELEEFEDRVVNGFTTTNVNFNRRCSTLTKAWKKTLTALLKSRSKVALIAKGA